MDVRLEKESVWLSAHQMALLFSVDRSGVVRHIHNIYKTVELKPKTTCAKNAHVAQDGRVRAMNFYNLDMIISVGYRVNSRRGTQFRIWATTVLRKHLIEGYTLHQKRLQELGTQELEQALALISRARQLPELSPDQTKGLLDIVTRYTQTWLLLRQYDDGEVRAPSTLRQPTYRLTYEDALQSIQILTKDLAGRGETSSLFGAERGNMLHAVIGTLYQTFDSRDLYPTVEEKAAHLLYFVIKDHPFTDGNKRIGVLLFLLFLQRNNGHAYKDALSDDMLVALALLIAESDPRQKSAMLRLILHFIAS